MKKYLMTGMAAIAFCAAFTSCSKDVDLYDAEAVNQMETAQVYEAYNRAFIATFGEVNPNQDWGFGKNFGKMGTRATGEFANHVGAYPDANMWTSKGFLAPDPLTRSQELRAQYYFQMNKITNPNNDDYGTRDFFMQQVYDGGTDPMPGKSPEKYLAADQNTLIESGEHMDHLTAGNGTARVHMYNFNNGNCSVNSNVANRNQTDVNNTSQQHSDKIMLMLNTPTNCFGYANSDASCVRDDRYALVSAATIDNFCDNDPGFAAWLAARLPAGQEDKKCDDEFHRGFIGFDFDMLPDDMIFAGTEHWEYGKPEYNYQPHFLGKTYSESDYYRYDLYGTKYHYLSANRNQYCGQSKTIDPEPQGDAALALLNDGWLPATGSANKTWVKVGGCNDGYYSDWIVTFMPGEQTPPPSDADVRIMAEDLNAQAADGDIENSDWDFNDVVFDVKFDATGNGGTITLVCAGGVLPLEVAGVEVHKKFDSSLKQDEKGWYPMINTGKGPNYPRVSFHIDNADKANNGQGISIVVYKQHSDGNWYPYALTAKQGQPAAKFAVKPTVEPLAEREHIDYVSGGAFSRGVQNGNYIWW